MIITDEPMPGVAEVGSDATFLLAVKYDEDQGRVTVIGSWPGDPQFFDRAVNHAKSEAHEFNELIVVTGIIAYRIWKKLEAPAEVNNAA